MRTNLKGNTKDLSKKGRKRFFILLAIVVLIIAAVVCGIIFKVEILRFFKADVIAKDAGIENVISVSSGSEAVTENGYVYIYSDNGISVYKSSGEFVRSYLLSYSNTKILSSGTHVIVYDEEATSYMVFEKGEKVSEYSMEEPISSIMAFDSYMFILCKGSSGYSGAVYAVAYQTDLITQTGYKNEIHYSSSYPVYIDMFSDKDKFVVVCCDPADMSKTYIEVYEIGVSTPVAGMTLTDFCPLIVCLENDLFLCAGSKSVYLYNYALIEKLVLDTENIIYIDGYDGCAYAYATIDSEYYEIKINETGVVDWKKAVGFEADGVSVSNGKIVLWNDQEITMLTVKGKDFHIISTDSRIQDVIIAKNNRLIILTTSQVITYKY
jgi:hypothetical protein